MLSLHSVVPLIILLLSLPLSVHCGKCLSCGKSVIAMETLESPVAIETLEAPISPQVRSGLARPPARADSRNTEEVRLGLILDRYSSEEVFPPYDFRIDPDLVYRQMRDHAMIQRQKEEASRLATRKGAIEEMERLRNVQHELELGRDKIATSKRKVSEWLEQNRAPLNLNESPIVSNGLPPRPARRLDTKSAPL